MPEMYGAFRQLKRTFDPDGIFNPGKIVDAPPIGANLRYGPAYRTTPVRTAFDYEEHGGFAAAVEMCSGLGACRKAQSGTMCPSFMATREETHSTRGRANALRLALSGRLGEAGLADEARSRGARSLSRVPRVQEPSVRSASTSPGEERVPADVLEDVVAVPCGREPWDTFTIDSRSGAVALRRCRMRSRGARPARGLNERFLGFDSRRTPPAWASHRSYALSRGGAGACRGAGEGTARRCRRVAIFVDTFTNFYSPSIGMAALDVLTWPGLACRSRPMSAADDR